MSFLSKNHIVLSIFWYLILSIGCFWQIFNVFKLYFEYPTNVFVETKIDSLIEVLPAITFCTNIDDHWNNRSDQLLKDQSEYFRENMFQYITIIDIDNHESNETDLINSEHKWLDNAVEQISLGYYCITLNTLLKAKTLTKLKRSQKIRFQFVRFGRYGWWIQMHGSYNLPMSSDWNAFQIEKDTHNLLTWNLRSFKLLETPYRTNCKDYRLKGKYLSRKDCFRKCKINASIDKCGAVAKDIDIIDGEAVQFGLNSDWAKCIYMIDFDDICVKKCPKPDCHIQYYEPVPYSTPWKSEYTRLDLMIPKKPETAYYHSPRIETIEFICYLASTFSMWFGFSMLTLYYLFSRFRNRFLKPDQRKFADKMYPDIQDRGRLMRDLSEPRRKYPKKF